MTLRNWLRTTACGLGGTLAIGAFAVQPAFADDQGGIETVVVTAEKTAENINDVGMSINAISGDDLLANGVTDPSALSKVTPGFVYARSAYGQPVYTMRGIGFYDTAFNASPGVSVYMDEAPLPYSAMTTGIMFDLQRIEVLKGPQGTLFGENSTGGALNLIAAKPTDAFASGLDLTYQQYGEVMAQGFVSGPLSDTVKARVAVSTDEGGAWQKSFTRNASTGATRRTAERLLLDWQPASNFTLSLNANGWQDNSDSQAGQFLAVTSAHPRAALLSAVTVYPVPPTNAREADWDPSPPFDQHNDFYQLSVRGEYRIDDSTTLTSISTYEYLKENSVVDTDGTYLHVFDVYNGGHIRTFAQELRLAGQSESLRWLLGGNYETDMIYEYGNPTTDTAYGTFPFPKAVTGTYEHVGTGAFFGNANYDLTDAITLQGGIRYTITRIHNRGCTLDPGTGQLASVFESLAASHGVTVTIPDGGCATLDAVTFQPGWVRGRLDQDNVSWRTGVNWKVADNSLLYANVSRGYKAGDFSPAGAIYSATLAPATQETVLAYEVGTKLALADNRLQLNGALFYYDYGNKQFRGKQPSPVIGSQNALLNIPKSRIEGAEFGATWMPLDHLRLNAGASYTASRIEGAFFNYTVLGAYTNLGGEALPQTPKWQETADAEYDFEISDGLGAYIGAHMNSQSSSNSALGNLALFKVNGYTNVDLRLGVTTDDGHWGGSVFVDNVGNTYSWNFVNLSGSDAVSRLANRPRIWGIKLDYRN
jgi:iron complex outermembrane receptor protein